jgi:hypothetical protein
MTNHPVHCRCGRLTGEISDPGHGIRGVCYCRDCQAFAHFLGAPGDVLDDMGGTEVVAVRPQRFSFTQGREHLACMSLTNGGLLRWYAGCCNTAIGNTPRDPRVAHLGLVSVCLTDPARSLESVFGPVRMRVNRQSAKGTPEAMTLRTLATVLPYMLSLAYARLSGGYRRNPFFDERTGAPVVAPRVLSPWEREQLMTAVGG